MSVNDKPSRKLYFPKNEIELSERLFVSVNEVENAVVVEPAEIASTITASFPFALKLPEIVYAPAAPDISYSAAVLLSLEVINVNPLPTVNVTPPLLSEKAPNKKSPLKDVVYDALKEVEVAVAVVPLPSKIVDVSAPATAKTSKLAIVPPLSLTVIVSLDNVAEETA